MSKLSNREVEQYYFEMFRRDYPLPSGVVEYVDKPDVVLRGERTIGVEITNLFLNDGALPESEQIQRSDRKQAVLRAERIYQQASAERFVLTFSFNPQVPIRDADELARRISSLASRIPGHEDGQLWREDFADIPELSFVYLNTRTWDGAHWRVWQMYSTPMLSAELLRKAIEQKEGKARGYKPCDAYWLLAVVDFMDRAQDQWLQPARLEGISSAVFEKIIIYKTHFGQVLEIDSGVGQKQRAKLLS